MLSVRWKDIRGHATFFLVRSSPNFGWSFGGLHRLLKPMII